MTTLLTSHLKKQTNKTQLHIKMIKVTTWRQKKGGNVEIKWWYRITMEKVHKKDTLCKCIARSNLDRNDFLL